MGEERTIWEADFYDGRVRQRADFDPGTRTVVLTEERDGVEQRVTFEVRDLRRIMKAVS